MTKEERYDAINYFKNKLENEVYGAKYNKLAIEALEQEPCEDTISRKSIKQKLQEHHDFFVNAYGGFSNLPQNDKSRVDEITNCIAMVVNEPSVTPQEPKTGHWIEVAKYSDGKHEIECSKCGSHIFDRGHANSYIVKEKYKYCPRCGAKMVEPQESEG